MKTFRLTAEAAGDIANIFDSIAQDSIDAAQRVGAEIYEEMKKLARNPRVGHKRQDLTSRELLFCAVYSYLIIYQPDTKPVNIIAVLHGRRNVKNPLKSAELGLPAILLFGTHEIKFAECTRNPPSGPSLVRT